MTSASLAGLLLAASILCACASPRVDVPRAFSEAWTHPEQTALGQAFASNLDGPDGDSGVRLLHSGSDAFAIRAALAESAQRTLDLQYYIIEDDTSTQLLLYRALKAARRGVRVRLLVDDLYALGRDFDLATFAANPNVEVRVFNPFMHRGKFGVSQVLEFLGDPTRLNRRMHNKLWIADNAAAVVGGRNLGDEYFDLSGVVNCYDLDVLAVGPVVREVSRSFDEYWNSEWAVPVEAFVKEQPDAAQVDEFDRKLETRQETFRDTDYARVLRDSGIGRSLRFGELPLAGARATAVFDDAAKVATTQAAPDPIFLRMRAEIEAARSEVDIISPYFIPTEDGIAMLGAVARRGVRVRILVNSLASTDFVPLAHSMYAHYRERLLSSGIELYEMRPGPFEAGHSRHPSASSGGYLHTKAMVVDRRLVVVGSMNHDPRSRASNTEVALFLASAKIGGQMAALFDQAVNPERAFHVVLDQRRPSRIEWIDEEHGRMVRHEEEPAKLWRRLLSALLGVVAPEAMM